VNKIVGVLPNEKKSAFVREAKEENIKDVVVDIMVATAPKVVKTVVNTVKNFFSSWW